jgi:hypothetical protein
LRTIRSSVDVGSRVIMVRGAFSSGKVCGLVDVGTSLFVGGIVTVVHGRFINIFYSDLL